MDKNDLPQEIRTARTLVRIAKPADLAEIESWPNYTGLFEGFSMTAHDSRSQDGRFWWQRLEMPDRCHYSAVLEETGEIIGVHALVRIGWSQQIVGNMAMRIRADMCDKGYGTESLQGLLDAVLDAGIRSVRLDVAATNKRAIRCYQKCGMRIVEEWWREGKGPDDVNDPMWSGLLHHFHRQGDRWLVRFYWLERSAQPTV